MKILAILCLVLCGCSGYDVNAGLYYRLPNDDGKVGLVAHFKPLPKGYNK